MLSAGLQPPQRLHSGANSPHVSVLLAGQHGLNARCSTRIPFGKGIHKISEDNPRSVRTTQAVAETAVGAGSGNLPAPVLPSPSQLALARRMLQVSFAATKFLSVLASTKWDQAVMGLPSGKERAAETLQELLTSLGPAFVKLAQTLSMRPDLIGDVYAGALVKLQDNVRPFPNEVAYQILEKELGKPLDQIFISLSTNPVASASLGQVYRGILRPEYGGGGSVAVKVQRPGAAESIALDVQLLRQLLGLVRRVLGIRRNLGVLADEIGAALQGECDFRNEVFNAQEFAKAHANLTFIITPRAVTELCTRKVLVSEWVDGRSPSQLLMPQKAGESAEDENSNSDVLSLVRMGIQCSLAQLLVTGCMHGGEERLHGPLSPCISRNQHFSA